MEVVARAVDRRFDEQDNPVRGLFVVARRQGQRQRAALTFPRKNGHRVMRLEALPALGFCNQGLSEAVGDCNSLRCRRTGPVWPPLVSDIAGDGQVPIWLFRKISPLARYPNSGGLKGRPAALQQRHSLTLELVRKQTPGRRHRPPLRSQGELIRSVH